MRGSNTLTKRKNGTKRRHATATTPSRPFPRRKRLNKAKPPLLPGSKANPVLILNDCPGLRFKEQAVQDMFLCLGHIPGFLHPKGELSIVFLPEKRHTDLHIEYHNNANPTDVITFKGDEMTDSAGEICVSPHFALEYSNTRDISFSNELALYLVHGWLHLAGFDDRDPAARRNMRDAEKQCLNALEKESKQPAFQFSP